MELNSLLNGIKVISKIDYKNVDINNLCNNSKEVKNNDLFFCINGTNCSGEVYANEAIKNGAAVIVT